MVKGVDLPLTEINTFIDQQLRTILHILDGIQITAPTCFSVRQHHIQRTPVNCKFLETHQMVQVWFKR